MAGWKTDAIMLKKWRPIIESFATSKEQPNDLELTWSELSAAQVENILRDIGYQLLDLETNGWEMDFTMLMAHSSVDYHHVSIVGCGMTQELSLKWETIEV